MQRTCECEHVHNRKSCRVITLFINGLFIRTCSIFFMGDVSLSKRNSLSIIQDNTPAATFGIICNNIFYYLHKSEEKYVNFYIISNAVVTIFLYIVTN